MTALHHPTDDTGLDLDELEIELARIDAALDRSERDIARASAEYLTACTADYAAHLNRIFAPYRGDPDLIPDPCPACGGTGEFEDEDGFVTDCKSCRPENPEPWIVPCRNDGTPY